MVRHSWERELEWVVKAGLLPEDRVSKVRQKASARNESPLEVLRDEGVLTPETVRSIRLELEHGALISDETPIDHEKTAFSDSFEDPSRSPFASEPSEGFNPESIPKVLPAGTNWGRFRLVSLLGEGGMGRVFKAYDPKLKRHVALKMMPGQDPRTTRRFVNEARAHARVEHDRVCKVFEVGEFQGAPFIAMQLIDGLPLHRMAVSMSLEQKLLVMLQVALGVHEAHRAGLIHRDIKPGNIMVERTEDGAFKPYVLDFGLARAPFETGMTVDGTLLGTPHYMSPEQARSQHDKLDRRSDVYALGASLYHILMGEPPFSEVPSGQVLSDILEREVPPLRKTRPEIPPEVETIVLKCMEKDPLKRYHSARALAEDLGRYLDGEPILAKPSGLLYRLLKKTRKHRLAFTFGASALLVILFLLAWSWATVRGAEQRQKLIRDFAARVKDIENMARLSSTVPAHDIRPDRALIQAEMDRIQQQAGLFGALGAGPGAYALGRGFLSLGDLENARRYLDQAWELGYREPEAAFALGRVYGDLFQKALWENQLIRSPIQREGNLRDIEHQYRDRALAFMRQTEGLDPGQTAFLQASVAFYEGRMEDALTILKHAPGRLSWFYEPRKLAGDIYRARAGSRSPRDEAEIDADYDRALRAYEDAARYAESDTGIFRSIAEVHLARLVKDFFGPVSVMPSFRQGLQAVDEALALNPDDVESLVLLSRLHYTLAEYRLKQSQDPVEDLEKAGAAARRAEALGGHASTPQKASAIAYSNLARWSLARGQDPSALIESALAAFDRVNPRDRDAEYYNKLGTTHMLAARYRTRSGLPADEAWHQAETVYREAIERFPQRPAAYINWGIYCHDHGVFLAESGSNPEKLLREGLTALEKGREIDPTQLVAYYYMGRIYGVLAQRAKGFAREALVEAAVTCFRDGLSLNPLMVHLHSGLGEVLYYQALHVWERGGDPHSLFDQAIEAYRNAISVDPDYVHSYINLGWAYLDKGRFLAELGDDPVGCIQDAVRVAQEALACGSVDIPSLCLGGAFLEWAGQDARSGRDPQTHLKNATRFFAVGLSLHGGWDYPHRGMGRILTLSARQLIAGNAEPDRIRESFQNAARSLEAALRADEGDWDNQLAMARLRVFQAGWSRSYGIPVESLISSGMEALDRLRKVPKYLPQVEAMDACFQLFQAGKGSEGVARAKSRLDEVLKRYPNQRPDWAIFLRTGD